MAQHDDRKLKPVPAAAAELGNGASGQPQAFPAQAVPVDINGTVRAQLTEAINRSAAAVAEAQARLATAAEAHQKNLGMLLLLDQLAAQNVGLAFSPAFAAPSPTPVAAHAEV